MVIISCYDLSMTLLLRIEKGGRTETIEAGLNMLNFLSIGEWMTLGIQQ